ncbi:unnamed protein product [Adineta ricciae]|uniref:Uncharacterized protein n=1 Tax=Adineta ricciae TaxID=249248 RepID=A0A814QEX1_ADIRI|nr:unnamed protein product [Adineta ricciae]
MASDDYLIQLEVENNVSTALYGLILEKCISDDNMTINAYDVQSLPTRFNTYVEKDGSDLLSPSAIVQNNHSFGHNDNKTKVAYIVLNGDGTLLGRLFTWNVYTGRTYLFEPNDQNVERSVNKYVEGINKIDLSSNQLPNEGISLDASDSARTEEQMDVEPTDGNDILESKWLITSMIIDYVLIHLKIGINSNVNGDQTADDRCEISNQSQSLDYLFSSPLMLSNGLNTFAYDTFPLSTTRKLPSEASGNSYLLIGNSNSNIHCESYSVGHFNEEDLSDSRTIDSPVNDAALAPIQLLSSSQASQKLYEGPTIIVSPKPSWKPRYQSDLIPKHKAKGEKKISIGLLQGLGGQRSRVTVKVPAKEEGRGVMYLACTVRTLENQKHELKLVLPKGTQGIEKAPKNSNILGYLDFRNCDPNQFFDEKEQIIYMKITDDEHGKEEKQVPVYLINQYQDNQLNTKRIEEEKLNQCRLSFYICEKVNEVYSCVSHESLSEPIVETKSQNTK